MTIESWELGLPDALRGQAIWRVQAYRLAAYAAHCATEDCDRVASSPSMAQVSSQLVRAVASVSANIAEGYGRRSRVDRIRYYEYALGSAGEAQSWYLAARTTLTPAIADARIGELNRVTRLLLAMIKNEREGRTWNARQKPKRSSDS